MPNTAYTSGWKKTGREDQRGGGWEKTVTTGDGGRASISSRSEPGSLSGAQNLPGTGKAPGMAGAQNLPGSGRAPGISGAQNLPWESRSSGGWTEGTRPEWGPTKYNPETGGKVPWSESQQKGWEGLVERHFATKEQRAKTEADRLAFDQSAHSDTFGLDQKKWESEEKKDQAARNMEMITTALAPSFGGDRVKQVMSSPQGQVGLENILKSVTDLAKNPDVTIEEAMPKIAAFTGAFNKLFAEEGKEVSPARQWEDMKPFWESIKDSGYAEPRVIQQLMETMEKDALKKEAEWLQNRPTPGGGNWQGAGGSPYAGPRRTTREPSSGVEQMPEGRLSRSQKVGGAMSDFLGREWKPEDYGILGRVRDWWTKPIN